MNQVLYCLLVAFIALFVLLFLQFIVAIISAFSIKFFEKNTASFWEIVFDEFVHMIDDCHENV